MDIKEITDSEIYQKLQRILPNKYLVIITCYLLYMIFLDSNNYRSQFHLWKEVQNLKKEKLSLEASLEEVKSKKEQLFSDRKKLEKFAREKYIMKKDDETLFVVVDQP
ncbi:MAG: septum formation initiator family protein [Chitinophagales bacterium]|nr:septum formation initiator family protein [Chitinophagales bacterium]MCZ2393917.1 septum formation initiator family protein [Chitinophagales bacterium]